MDYGKNRDSILNQLTLTTTTTMPNTNHDIENGISKAVKSLDSQGKPNVANTIRDFRVLPSRLRNRWNGRHFLIPGSEKHGTWFRISHDEALADKALRDWMEKLGKVTNLISLDVATARLLTAAGSILDRYRSFL